MLRAFGRACAEDARTLAFRIHVLPQGVYILECTTLHLIVSHAIHTIPRTIVSFIDIVNVFEERLDALSHAIYSILHERILLRKRPVVFLEPTHEYTDHLRRKLTDLLAFLHPIVAVAFA